jgi:pimeloyl-ACP methyl ester carboxylesterase
MANQINDLSYLKRMNAFSCRYDPTFPYYFYVPENYLGQGPRNGDLYKLVVLIHGNERGAEMYRNAARQFAEFSDSVILAPLFPAGLVDYSEIDNFGFVRYKGLNFDTILTNMIDDICWHFPIDSEKIYLHGFSAGGQFAHRFFYAYPELIHSLSIGACSRFTLLDGDLPWPQGTKDISWVFEREPDASLYPQARIQLVIGEDDNFIFSPQIHFTRMELLAMLRENYVANGLSPVFSVVPKAGHQGLRLLSAVFDFFAAGMHNQ